MPLRNHIEKSLEINNVVTPLYKMLMSAGAITLPLALGFITGDIQPAMFGSLMGLVLYLNDHFGDMLTRVKHLIVTFIFLMLSMWLGTVVQGQLLVISIIIFVLSFLLGKSKTFGIELERMMLFITLQFLTTSSESVVLRTRPELLKYSFLSFAIYLLVLAILSRVFRHETHPMKSKRHTFTQAMQNQSSMRFSLLFAVVALAGYHLVLALKLSHPYWVVGTAIIVMLPDSIQGIYKSFQRFIGTLTGVMTAAIILLLVHDPKIILIFVFVCSLYMPSGLAKNYWVGNIYIAALILFFLEISAPQSIATQHLAYWRIVDITLGSFLGIVASFLINPSLFKKATASLKF